MGAPTALVLRRVSYVFVLPDSENVRTLSMTRSEIRRAPSETVRVLENYRVGKRNGAFFYIIYKSLHLYSRIIAVRF